MWCLLWTVCALGAGVDGSALSDDVADGLRARGFSGQVAAAISGEVVARASTGEAADGTPVTDETLFYIHDIAMTFTAAVALQLCDEESLRLDASIAEYLSEVPDEKRDITVRHLLWSRSGLPERFPDPEAEVSRAEFVEWALAAPLRWAPGRMPGYSEVDFPMLAAIIERVEGRPFAEVVEERVFDPAGMDGAMFLGDPRLREKAVAVGAAGEAAGRFGFDGDPRDLPRSWARMGRGDVVATANDLLAWGRAVQNEEALSLKRLEATAPEGFDRRFDPIPGWKRDIGPDGSVMYGDDHHFPGFFAMLLVWPRQNLVAASLSNRPETASASDPVLTDLLSPLLEE